MYTCGRGTDGFGTVLPAVLQAQHAGLVGTATVTARSRASLRAFDAKLHALESASALQLDVRRAPPAKAAWRAALTAMPPRSAVLVVTPDDMHHAMAAAAIDAGHHVLVVKPLTPTADSARDLAERARLANVWGAVEFHKRFDPAYRQLKQSYMRGDIGHPCFVHVEYSQRRHIPAQQLSGWAARSSSFQYLGCHYVDLIHDLTGAFPLRMVATSQRGAHAAAGLDVDDATETLIVWDQHFTSIIVTHWIDPDKSTATSQQGIRIVGTRGSFTSDHTRRGQRLLTERGLEEPNPFFCAAYPDPLTGALRHQGYGIDSIMTFLSDIDALDGGRVTREQLETHRPGFRSAVVSSAVIEGARMSLAHDGAWVGFDAQLNPRAMT